MLRLPIILLLQAACFATEIHFSGQVAHGHAYQRKISTTLSFCLFPEPDANGGGWRIAVQQQCTPHDDDFVAVATPPMYGVNPREIEAWQFEPGANAPQRVRAFSFVLNDQDFRRLLSDLNNYKDAGKMLSEISALGQGHGTLTIKEMQTGRVADMPVFESMKFAVTLSFPGSSPLRSGGQAR